MKTKILFSLDGFLLHYCLAYYLKSHLDADFFGLIDINSKPKKFFENQTLVEFRKKWFFHDHIKKTDKEPDLDYLRDFEKKYKIDLWKLLLNERFFYLHNRFYKFEKKEILSILEQEIKFYESILEEIKPDYFLTYDPVFHHQKLLLDLCKSKGIKILSTIIGTGIKNKTIIVEDGATYDLDENDISKNSFKRKIDEEKINKKSYDSVFQQYLKKRNTGFSNKITALKDYLFSFDGELINSNFMYFGKSKLKVIKDAMALELKRSYRYNFLQKNSIANPKLNSPFVYFPMSIEEEMNLLHYAPYYTNQIEVIRHIAKAIPISHMLYVKEHIAAGLRGWHDKKYYKEIIDLPNVKFINPQYDNKILIKNSDLVITIRGLSSVRALEFNKPSIVFGTQPVQIMPSVFRVESLMSLPEIIKKAINHKVEPSEYKRYEQILDERLFEFNMFEYENKRDESFFSGGILSNVPISEKNMVNFLKKNKDMFLNLSNAHLKIISDQHT